MAVQLGLDVSHGGGVTMVTVRGELDAATAPDLDRLLQLLVDAGTVDVALDVGDLGFIDSHGLDAIVQWRARLAAVGGDVLLYRPTRLALRLLEAMGLRDQLRVVAAEATV